MAKPKHSNAAATFHAEGWHPALVAFLGVAAGAVFVSLAYLLLVRAGLPTAADSGAVLAAVVTATAGGGAAGLAMKNLNLKRSESRRDTNLMFDEQFRSGAQLLGGATESEVIAGSLLIGSLLQESPRHSQACANLLVAALREARLGDPDLYETERLEAQDPDQLDEPIARAHRIRNAVTKAVAASIQVDGAPLHVASTQWGFDGARFGDQADFSRCLFGRGTAFIRCHFAGEASFTGATFVDGCHFEHVSAPGGLSMGGVRSDGQITFSDCTLAVAAGSAVWGLGLNGARIAGVRIQRLRTGSGVCLDDAVVDGDIRLVASKVDNFTFIDGRCNRFVVLDHLEATRHICVRNTPVRKGVKLVDCDAGTEIEVMGIVTQGTVEVRDSSAPISKLDQP